AIISIVQNYRDDGPEAMSTAFHEGGHFLDYSHRADLLGNGSATAYSETHSMMMETFLTDPEFLNATARARDGTAIPKELMQKFIANHRVNQLFEFRKITARALFDLLL